MSERSSRRDALAPLAAIVLATGCAKAGRPEANPETAKQLAATMVKQVPMPAGVPDCKLEETIGGATLTFRTLLQIAGEPIPNDAEHADWINPTSFDHPAARALAEPTTDATLRRQAAAELVGAPFYFVYKVDNMSAPIAGGRRETSRGSVGMRAIKYDRAGRATCVVVYNVKNTRSKAEWAMDEIEKHAILDPKVVQAMRDDLHEQQILAVQRMGLPVPPPSS